MRSFMAFLALLGAALVLVAGSGCGGTEEGRTDIAKLEPPAPSVGAQGRAKVAAAQIRITAEIRDGPALRAVAAPFAAGPPDSYTPASGPGG